MLYCWKTEDSMHGAIDTPQPADDALHRWSIESVFTPVFSRHTFKLLPPLGTSPISPQRFLDNFVIEDSIDTPGPHQP